MKILGIFDRLESLLKGIEAIRKTYIPIDAVYSPAPVEEIWKTLGMRRSRIRWFVLFGGCFGLVFAYFVAIYSASAWKLDVWGKPFISWLPYSLIAYVWTILAAVIACFFGVLILGRGKSFRDPPLYNPGFTVDRFGIVVRCYARERETVIGILRETGAERIDESSS